MSFTDIPGNARTTAHNEAVIALHGVIRTYALILDPTPAQARLDQVYPGILADVETRIGQLWPNIGEPGLAGLWAALMTSHAWLFGGATYDVQQHRRGIERDRAIEISQAAALDEGPREAARTALEALGARSSPHPDDPSDPGGLSLAGAGA